MRVRCKCGKFMPRLDNPFYAKNRAFLFLEENFFKFLDDIIDIMEEDISSIPEDQDFKIKTMKLCFKDKSIISAIWHHINDIKFNVHHKLQDERHPVQGIDESINIYKCHHCNTIVFAKADKIENTVQCHFIENNDELGDFIFKPNEKKYIEKTRDYFLEIFNKNGTLDFKRSNQKDKKPLYPEWLIMLIAAITVKLKIKSFAQIHRKTTEHWDVLAKDLNLKPISEKQLRKRLRNIDHYPDRPAPFVFKIFPEFK